MTVNAQKRNSRVRRSARTGRRTKLTGFSTKSFFAGIAVGILGTSGVSLVPSLIPGSTTSSQRTDKPPGPDSSSTRYEFWETLPTNDVAVDTNPYEMSTTKSAAAKEYLLQAGSFRKQDEADALRAHLRVELQVPGQGLVQDGPGRDRPVHVRLVKRAADL